MLESNFFHTKITEYTQQHQDFIGPVGMTLNDDLSIQDIGHGLISFIVYRW